MADIAIRTSNRFGVSAPALVGLIVFAATLAGAGRVLQDPDCYLHVVVGRWIVAHGAVPRHDVFSYTAVGAPWVAHEWLAEIILAWLHDAFGWAGSALAAAICFAAAIALLTRALMTSVAPTHALIGAALGAGLCFPHLFARPHVFALPILVVWVAALAAARAEDRAPPLYLALFMTLWANLHGGYVFGLALVALFAAEAVYAGADWRAALRAGRSWSAFAALALLATFLTPNGIDGLLLPFRLTAMDFALSSIREWQSPNFQSPQPLEPWLMLVLLGALSLGVRLPATRIAMLLLLLHMTLQHQRHAELLGLAAPLLLAPSLAPRLKAYAFARVDRRLTNLQWPGGARGVALLGILVLGLAGVARQVVAADVEGPPAPAAALAFVEARHVAGPVFNDINFGDYLIFAGVAPFIDGRVDVYGDAFLKRYSAVGEFPDLAARYGFAWAILAPKNPHVALLDNLTGWRRYYADDVAVVYVREDGGALR